MNGAGPGTLATVAAPIASARNAATRATASVGMAIALGAVAMCFAALLLGYAIVRAQAPSWPPPGEAPVPRHWPWLLGATVAALAGSIAMRAAVRIADTQAPRAARRIKVLLLAAAGAGAAFIAVQISGWTWLAAAGVRPSSGIAASVVYALTLFHALHALAALIALMPALVRTARGGVVGATALRMISSFWHLVTIVWLVVFFAVFVA